MREKKRETKGLERFKLRCGLSIPIHGQTNPEAIFTSEMLKIQGFCESVSKKGFVIISRFKAIWSPTRQGNMVSLLEGIMVPLKRKYENF